MCIFLGTLSLLGAFTLDCRAGTGYKFTNGLSFPESEADGFSTEYLCLYHLVRIRKHAHTHTPTPCFMFLVIPSQP